MAEQLLITAQLGFLSDPLPIPLYYLIGRDRDGLNIYRCIRGTRFGATLSPHRRAGDSQREAWYKLPKKG
jgi:hypothetical protein